MLRELIESKVAEAVQKLVNHDACLLEVDVNERSITHRLGAYLQEVFPEWHVDCEYNRDGDVPKRLRSLGQPFSRSSNELEQHDTDARTVFPDPIVHRRGTGDNLLVMEVKKTTSRVSDDIDVEKLDAYAADLGLHARLVSQDWDCEGLRNRTTLSVAVTSAVTRHIAPSRLHLLELARREIERDD